MNKNIISNYWGTRYPFFYQLVILLLDKQKNFYKLMVVNILLLATSAISKSFIETFQWLQLEIAFLTSDTLPQDTKYIDYINYHTLLLRIHGQWHSIYTICVQVSDKHRVLHGLPNVYNDQTYALSKFMLIWSIMREINNTHPRKLPEIVLIIATA